VDQLIRAVAEFDASHTDGSRVRCHRDHGHHWTVTVEKKVSGDGDLEVDLHALISEWQDRSLDEMLHVKAQSSVERLAAWTMERLLLRHPTIVRVEFSDGRLTGIAMQELKR